MTSIPLVRMLTDAGFGSRRDVSKLVNEGLVEVNGRIASSYTEKVDPDVDSIVVTGNKVAQGSPRRVYLIMNKPEGYLSTTEDDRDRPTVLDLLPENVKTGGLHPAGRLDEDSTGLLVLTNDGQLTYEITHPRFEHEKEYWVATTGRLTDADVEKLEQGVEIEEQMTRPARVRILLGQSPYTYSVTIHEGRKRQVRMMFAAIGQQVAMLKRVRLGGLLLGDLHEGDWRELTTAELKALMLKRPRDLRQSGVGPATPRGAAQLARYPGRPASSNSRTSASRNDTVRFGEARVAASPYNNGRSAPRPGIRSERTQPGTGRFQPRSDDFASPAVRTEQRQSFDRAPDRFRRADSGPSPERRDRRPAQDRDSRSYERSSSRPPTGRSYARPTGDREPGRIERAAAGAYPDNREPRPRPALDRGARSYERSSPRPTMDRPYSRPADNRRPTGPARPNQNFREGRFPERSNSSGAARPDARRERDHAPDRSYGRTGVARDSRPATRGTSARSRHSSYGDNTHTGRTTNESGGPARQAARGASSRDRRPQGRTGASLTGAGDASRPPRPQAPEGHEKSRRTSPSAERRRPEARR